MKGDAGPIDHLSPNGVDLRNQTQAAEFLEQLLNDDQLKIIGNAYARYFWYGVAAVIAVSTIVNHVRKITLLVRLVRTVVSSLEVILTTALG